MFHYSAYWMSWSRQLDRLPGFFEGMDVVEVNLIDLQRPAETKDVWIRRHGTAPGRNDLLVKELPAKVVAEMHRLYGVEATHRLLTEDFLPQIDWNKYRKVSNGGASLASCKKD